MLRSFEGMPTSALKSLLDGPLSAVRGAVDALRYAQAFVAHARRPQEGLRTDDDERDLILEEELGEDATPASAVHAVEPPAA
jgi:hypothetical protein